MANDFLFSLKTFVQINEFKILAAKRWSKNLLGTLKILLRYNLSPISVSPKFPREKKCRVE